LAVIGMDQTVLPRRRCRRSPWKTCTCSCIYNRTKVGVSPRSD